MPTFSQSLERGLRQALIIANEHNHEYATLEHLLFSLLDDKDAISVMRACGVKVSELKEDLKDYIENKLKSLIIDSKIDAKPTPSFQRVVQRAVLHVQSSGREEVTGASILVAIFAERESHAVYLLQKQGITRYDTVNYISHGISKLEGLSGIEGSDDSEKLLIDEESHEDDDQSQEDDVLKKYCINLNRKAMMGQIDPLIGREKEIERLVQILCRRRKNNPLFVGESGVGKTAMAEGLADKIVKGSVPEVLKNSTIFELDMGSLLAGTRYRGDFEERLKAVVKALQNHNGAIMFLDEIHTLIGAGATSGGAMDASNLLKPALQSGKLKCVGSTTYNEYRQYFEKDRALIRRFQKIDIYEPSTADSIKILEGLRSNFEKFYNIKYTDEAIRQAVELSVKYMHDRKLPDKAIDIIDEAGASQMIVEEKQRLKTIGIREIEKVVSQLARIPEKTVSKSDVELLTELDQNLKRVVFGQDEAIGNLASAIKMSRAGLREPGKPVGCYLFSGPTGVGKTEVSRQLAFALGIELVRFDMSEYMERHAVSRLIGAPPGYVGFDNGGLLTDAIDHQPHCVLLLDEIEKAHPDIVNIMLQVMDYGKLTDNNGRTVDFSNVILIMTSNAGAFELSRPTVGFATPSKRSGDDKEAIKKLFSPEFRNRLDAIIGFSSLGRNTIYRVVEKMMMQIESQIEDRNITISVTEKACDWLAKVGYDEANGARQLSRTIQEYVKKPLADEILFSKLSKGGHVVVDIKKIKATKTAKAKEEICFQIETEEQIKKKSKKMATKPSSTAAARKANLSTKASSQKKVPKKPSGHKKTSENV